MNSLCFCSVAICCSTILKLFSNFSSSDDEAYLIPRNGDNLEEGEEDKWKDADQRKEGIAEKDKLENGQNPDKNSTSKLTMEQCSTTIIIALSITILAMRLY